MDPYYQLFSKEAEGLYWKLTCPGKNDQSVGEALVVALHGRIDTLFVPVVMQSRGSFDERQHTVTMHTDAQLGDEYLLDLTALQTLATGGTVFAISPQQMPDSGSVAAIFRN